METKLSNGVRQVVIGYNRPTVMIGERINPTGKKKLAAALREGRMDMVRQEALAQVAFGAGILDVNVVADGVDEIETLPRVIEAILEVVDVPLCIDINNPKALAKALAVYPGKALVNSVSGEKRSLEEILPLILEYKAAVIGLTLDDNGIPKTAEKRLEIAHTIVEQAESLGIPREDIIIDPLALALGSDHMAAGITLRAIRMIHDELGLNQTLGASNISFGLPDRMEVNKAFLPLAIFAGVTCPTVDPVKVGTAVFATDLILGRDRFSMNYIKDFRRREKNRQQEAVI